jgi:magnesium transporter
MSTSKPAVEHPGPIRVPCLHNPDHNDVDVHLDDKRFVWIDLEDPSEADIAKIADKMGLHPLTVEDAVTFHQRPKIEDYEGYLSMVVFGVDSDAAAGSPLLREVHLIVSGEAVVTIHHRPVDSLAELRTRYGDRAVRSEQFLVYKILDAIISTFVPVLSRVDDTIDDLEQDVINVASTEDLQKIFSLRRDLVAMRRVIAPMRDMFQRDAETIAELPGLQTDDKLYFRDLYDGLIRTSELVDSYRDLLSGATDMYLSTVANKQGEVGKQLAIIATIFLPLSFLTGFFGQNFSFLTNHIINHTWTFFVFGLGLLIASVIALWVFFQRKGWVGRSSP